MGSRVHFLSYIAGDASCIVCFFLLGSIFSLILYASSEPFIKGKWFSWLLWASNPTYIYIYIYI